MTYKMTGTIIRGNEKCGQSLIRGTEVVINRLVQSLKRKGCFPWTTLSSHWVKVQKPIWGGKFDTEREEQEDVTGKRK